MMKPCRLAAVLLALAVYAGASPAATPRIDENALAGMRKGQTTFDEIVRRFGRPNFGSKNWDGRTAAYAYGEGWSPNALTALNAVLGGSPGNTVVLYFNDRDVLTDYKINQATAKPGEAPATPTVRYVEPSFGATKPAATARPAAVPAAPTVRYVEPSPAGGPPPAVKPAAAAAAKPVEAAPLASAPPATPEAAQASKPEQRNDGLPSWLPSSSTRGDRY